MTRNRHQPNRQPARPAKTGAAGVSLAEILVALAIFSSVVVGLLSAINGVNKAIGLSMKRDIEASYVNMIMAEINPHDRLIELNYNKTSTSCGGDRCSMQLPNGETFWYTVRVNSEHLSGDLKRVNIYLYRDATTTTPYRVFRREFVQPVFYHSGSPSLSALPYGALYYRDSSGQVWSNYIVYDPPDNATLPFYNGNAGERRYGVAPATNIPSAVVNLSTTPPNVVDLQLWRSQFRVATGTTMDWTFPATQNRTYTVQMGFNDWESSADGERGFDIYINGSKVDEIDIFRDAGGANRALVKFYTTTAMVESGRAVIKVQLLKTYGVAARPPILSWIAVFRE